MTAGEVSAAYGQCSDIGTGQPAAAIIVFVDCAVVVFPGTCVMSVLSARSGGRRLSWKFPDFVSMCLQYSTDLIVSQTCLRVIQGLLIIVRLSLSVGSGFALIFSKLITFRPVARTGDHNRWVVSIILGHSTALSTSSPSPAFLCVCVSRGARYQYDQGSAKHNHCIDGRRPFR